jgi:hypothetical protein
MNSLYKKYKNQVDRTRCSSCMGYGKLYFEGPDNEGVGCETCKGTGLKFSDNYQEDREFFLNLLKLFSSDKDWRKDKEYILDTIQMNPALHLIKLEHQDDSYVIVFKSHSCFIEQGKLKKFY